MTSETFETILVTRDDRVATITLPHADWFGSEVITFRATDSDGLYGEDAVTFTVSIGAAQLHADDSNGIELFGRADAALYVAKATGRNKVSVEI